MELKRIDERLERIEADQGQRLDRIEEELQGIRDDQNACNVWRQDFERAQAEQAQAARESEAEQRGGRRMLRLLVQQGILAPEAAVRFEQETDEPPPPRVAVPTAAPIQAEPEILQPPRSIGDALGAFGDIIKEGGGGFLRLLLIVTVFVGGAAVAVPMAQALFNAAFAAIGVQMETP